MTTILRVKIGCLSRDESAALFLLAETPMATSHIQRKVGLPDVPAARRMLKRLERQGLVETARRWRPGDIHWWQITDAGRSAIDKVVG
ncbi:winged helix-turn-helix domain-containing protein [Bosea sp. TWI1241]|uniref:winged helix-turn-helix domain-containing protein n=1 Tax=Bosea sp. TWI1241 TaxID=3148904 RepID=UPI003208BA4D